MNINNISYSYSYIYSLNCKECLCYGLTSNRNYSLINCYINTKLCYFYLNINIKNSFYSNINSSIYFLQSFPTYSSSLIQSTNIFSLTTISSTISSCIGSLLITFDDIINSTKTDSAIPILYNCFRWINGWYINVTTADPTSGYKQVLTSGIYVCLNRNGTSMNMTLITNSFFYLNSLIISSAYQTSLHLLIQGIQYNNIILYRQDIILSPNLRKNLSLNWFNLTTVNFQSYYYDTYLNKNISGLGYQFAIDNINVTLY